MKVRLTHYALVFDQWLVKEFGFDADFGFGDAVDVFVYLAELFVARIVVADRGAERDAELFKNDS